MRQYKTFVKRSKVCGAMVIKTSLNTGSSPIPTTSTYVDVAKIAG